MTLSKCKPYIIETRATAHLAVPFVGNQLLLMAVATIDSIMAGRDSKLTLAAVAQGVMLWDVFSLVVVGLLMPMTAMVAKYHTQKNAKNLRLVFQQSIWLAVLLGIASAIAIYHSPAILWLFGIDKSITEAASQYLHIVAFSMPFIALFLIVRFFNEGIANPKIIMLMTATSIPVNIIGNTILLNGLLGFPRMGAAGIAIASTLAWIYLAVIAWGYCLHSKHMRTYQLLKDFSRPVKQVIRQYLLIGIPNAVALTLEISLFAVIVLLSGKLGIDAASSNQIVFNYSANVYMISLGISMALTTRIAMAMGDSNRDKARTIGLSGMVLSIFTMLLSMLIVALFGEHITALYSNDYTVRELALSLLAIVAFFQLFDGIFCCGAGALRGLEETKAPMRYTMIYAVITMPLAALLAFHLHLSVAGLWLAMIIGVAVAAFLSARKYLLLTGALSTSAPPPHEPKTEYGKQHNGKQSS